MGRRFGGALVLVVLGAMAGFGTPAHAADDIEERTIPISTGGPAQAMAFDEAGRLWLAVKDLGLVRYDPDSGSTVELEIDGVTSETDLLPDREGAMWVNLPGLPGVARVPIDADDASEIEQVELDQRTALRGMTFDQRGRVWVTDYLSDRLYRIDGSDLDAGATPIQVTRGSNPGTVQRVGDELWHCANSHTVAEISRVDPGTGETIEPPIDLWPWSCSDLLPVGDDVYVGTVNNQVLVRIRDRRIEELVETPGRAINRLAVDERDRVWISPGTYPLNRIDGHLAWSIEDEELLPPFGAEYRDNVAVAVAPDGDVWFASGQVGSPPGTVAVQRVEVGADTTEPVLAAFRGVPGFSDALTPENVGKTAGLSLLVVLFVMFPSTLVNATLEGRRDRLPWMRNRRERRAPRHPILRLAILLAALPVVYITQAFIFELRDPRSDLGFVDTALQALGSYGVGVLVATLVMAVSEWWSFKKAGVKAGAEVQSSTLPIAIGCAVISALVGFQPGFVFGLIIAVYPRRPVEPRTDARRVSWSAWVAAGVALVAWISADAFTNATYPWLACMGIYVAGVEVVFLEMAPLRFLPGHLVWSWQIRRWIAVWVPGVFLFLLGLVAPGVHDADALNLSVAIALVVVFNVGAFAFWLWGRSVGQLRPDSPDAIAN